MEKLQSRMNKPEEVKSIQHALQTLNEAAKDSSQEIKTMVDKDFKKLKTIMSDVKPEVRQAFNEMGEATKEQVQNAKETVNESVHHHPWVYIGGAAAVAGLTGFIMGRKSK